ncbi:radical SAM protein [Candidatus Curtissbacteria bacterium]|nr:radical SAM protein [Candidatus Curtissbacteria bacterium]
MPEAITVIKSAGAETEAREPALTTRQKLELKMKIFERGVVLSDAAREKMGGPGGNLLTTDHYYVTTRDPILNIQGTFINSPVSTEDKPFSRDANKPPYMVAVVNDSLVLEVDGRQLKIDHLPPPEYQALGDEVSEDISTHTDRGRESPLKGCKIGCHFCNIPWEFQKAKMTPVDKLVKAAKVAIADKVRPMQHLLLSGGTPKTQGEFDYLQDVYRKMAEEFVKTDENGNKHGLDIEIMMTPSVAPDGTDLLDLDGLHELGIKRLSINMELGNMAQTYRVKGEDGKEREVEIMAGKNKIGKEQYMNTLKRAVQLFGVGNVKSMLIVGLEPVEQTLQLAEELAQIGVCPELSPFRPDPLTPLGDHPPASFEDQIAAYDGVQEIIAKYKSEFPGLSDGLECVDCMHNVDMIEDEDSFRTHYDPVTETTTYMPAAQGVN